MALPANWLKVTLVCRSPQKDHFYNVFYYVPDADPTFTDDGMADSNTLGTNVQGVIVAGLAALMTTVSFIDGTTAELHKGGIIYTTSQILGVAGTVAGDELADFEAVVIQKRTNVPGKSGRGRWYFGPLAEGLTDENYLTTIGHAAAVTVATAWKQPVVALGANWLPHLFSPLTDQLTPIQSTFVDPKIGQIGGRKSHSIL